MSSVLLRNSLFAEKSGSGGAIASTKRQARKEQCLRLLPQVLLLALTQSQMEVKKKIFLRSRAQESLRALSPHVVLALGFPTLAAVSSAQQSQAVNASQRLLFGDHKVGNPTTELLFQKLLSSIEEKMEAKPNTFGRPEKAPVGCDADEGSNPYADNREHQESSKLEKLLDLYVEGGVFTAVHEHVVMMLETAGDDDDRDWKARILSCLSSIMATINLLMTTEVLSSSGSTDTKVLFSQLLGQLASGNPKGR